MTTPATRVSLGNGSVEISRLALGGMALRRSRGLEHAAGLIDRAIDSGVTTVDTAPLYDYGGSESILGELLKTRRHKLEVLTKIGLRWDADHGDVLFEADEPQLGRVVVRRNSRPDSIRHEVDASLQRLQIERIDLVQVHQFDRHVPVADTMGCLADLRDAGKLRAIGVSNYTTEQASQAHAALGGGLANLQSPYSLLAREVETRELRWARRHEVGFLAYSPLAEGVLAGRMLNDHTPPNDHRSEGIYYDPRNLERIHSALRSVVQPIAQNHSVSLGAVALTWLMAQPGVTAVIAGASSNDQLAANVGALSLELDTNELRAIDDAFATFTLIAPSEPGLVRRAWRKLQRGLAVAGVRRQR